MFRGLDTTAREQAANAFASGARKEKQPFDKKRLPAAIDRSQSESSSSFSRPARMTSAPQMRTQIQDCVIVSIVFKGTKKKNGSLIIFQLIKS